LPCLKRVLCKGINENDRANSSARVALNLAILYERVLLRIYSSGEMSSIMSGGSGAGAGAPGFSSARSMAAPVGILRNKAKYNTNVRDVSDFDITKLNYLLPPPVDGKVSFFKDGLGNTVVPLTYDGEPALNYGWIIRHGKFDFLESPPLAGKKDARPSWDLVAHFPVTAAGDAAEYAPSDARDKGMLALLKAFHDAEFAAVNWMVKDTAGAMFGVHYTAADLESRIRVDGTVERGKFTPLLRGGRTPAGIPAKLKSYLKCVSVSDDASTRILVDLTVDGRPVPATVDNLKLNANWRNDVGIVFSFRDLYKSAYGISLRVRLDCIGVEAAPRAAPIVLFNPFARKMEEEAVTLGTEYDDIM
jgi:hypothetical protein